MTKIAALMPDLIDLIQKAGHCIMAIYESDHQVSQKKDESPVTAADLAAEKIILEGLKALTPHIPVIAEEATNAGQIPAIGKYFWLVDPLDGTKEFIQKNGEFTVNIALVEDGKPLLGLVLAPALDELYGGIVGQGAWLMSAGTTTPISARKPLKKGLTVVSSRSHGDETALAAFLQGRKVVDQKTAGSSLKLCLIANGQADLYPRLGRTMEWDIAAGHAVLSAAGGEVMTLQHAPLRYGKPGLDNPHFYAQGKPDAVAIKPRDKKIFLLGVGAQKAGTTWLYEYLDNHPNTDLGFEKEYHIFDALFIPECSDFLSVTVARTLQHLSENTLQEATEKNLFKRVDFLDNTDNYFDYFEALVKKSPSAKLTGDITPSYSALPVKALQLIKNQVLKRGLRPRVVFLMRDPVERCISSARMNLRRSQTAPLTEEQENQLLRVAYKTRNYEIRTRYDETIRNLETVFEPFQIFYGFYETLFTQERIESLCKFLEIPLVKPDFNHKTNVSRTNNQINPELLKEIYSHYEPVYEFVSKKFGVEFIREIWPTRLS
ncbi:MAG: 3'(2'),5'-bisphosphate nucleotidase CysQ [Burkholderiales bacterium]|jgi:3'(2'), 5'-bisphosphate nucleotidase|nr:3'(2'),5'-bisphosphate nucleotidase CysQ [Burkholderiales bacterium]